MSTIHMRKGHDIADSVDPGMKETGKSPVVNYIEGKVLFLQMFGTLHFTIVCVVQSFQYAKD